MYPLAYVQRRLLYTSCVDVYVTNKYSSRSRSSLARAMIRESQSQRECVEAFHCSVHQLAYVLKHKKQQLWCWNISLQKRKFTQFQFYTFMTQSECASTVWVKKAPPEVFWHFFPNGWQFLLQILHTYYTFLSMLEYKFLFNFLQLWRCYYYFVLLNE